MESIDKKKLFIFDLDGTLADAYRAIEKSLNFTLEKLGYPPAGLERVKRSVGMGDKIFIDMFFSPKDADKALKIYRNHHKQSLIKYAKLKPFAGRLLYSLKRKKKILAIASNRPRYFTNILLATLKIKKYFDVVYCGGGHRKMKPDPEMLKEIISRFKMKKTEAVYSGDMGIDLETARRAGIDAVFVKGGSSYLPEVRKYKNKIVVSGLKEFLELTKKRGVKINKSKVN